MSMTSADLRLALVATRCDVAKSTKLPENYHKIAKLPVPETPF